MYWSHKAAPLKLTTNLGRENGPLEKGMGHLHFQVPCETWKDVTVDGSEIQLEKLWKYNSLATGLLFLFQVDGN